MNTHIIGAWYWYLTSTVKFIWPIPSPPAMCTDPFNTSRCMASQVQDQNRSLETWALQRSLLWVAAVHHYCHVRIVTATRCVWYISTLQCTRNITRIIVIIYNRMYSPGMQQIFRICITFASKSIHVYLWSDVEWTTLWHAPNPMHMCMCTCWWADR